MNVVFIGASSFGMKCLQEILKIPGITITGILSDSQNIKISAKNTTISNAKYVNFSEIANDYGIPHYELSVGEKCSAVIPVIKQWNPDLMLVCGWYRIIPRSVTEIGRAHV